MRDSQEQQPVPGGEPDVDDGGAAAPVGGDGFSYRRLKVLITTVLVVAVLVFTGGVFWLIQGIFDAFVPAVKADLEWKTERGVEELSRSTELGIIVQDEAVVRSKFADYESSKDVVSLVAMTMEGTIVARYGDRQSIEEIFEGESGSVREKPGLLMAWESASIEGVSVGKVGIVVSTFRLQQSEAILNRILQATGVAAFLALIGGVFFVGFFTNAVSERDAQLAAYAATLEAKVAQRADELRRRGAEMRLVLDNVEQGFVTLDLEGVMATEKSKVVEEWFGAPEEGVNFWEYIKSHDPDYAANFQFGFEALLEDILPLEMYLYQLPGQMHFGGQTFRIAYTPILSAPEELRQLMVVITDVTAHLEAEASARLQKQAMAMFERIMRDRSGFEEFLRDCQDMVEMVCGGEHQDDILEKRLVHTLKGNTSIYGILSVADVCHVIETRAAESEGPFTEADRALLQESWTGFRDRAQELLGTRSSTGMEFEHWEHGQLLGALDAGEELAQVAAMLRDLKLEPVMKRLQRLGEKTQGIAERLGKPPLCVHAEGQGIRLDPEHWSPFWSALVHVIRNAVDHGIEAPEEREEGGKVPGGALAFKAYRDSRAGLVLEVSDDGKGIDWNCIRDKALQQGLPADTPADLQAALFHDGLSSRDEVSELSGRGVGMSAVLQETEQRGGAIEVLSRRGLGTTFRFSFPEEKIRDSATGGFARRAS